ncbi:DUF6368 family protein [Streptomyces sp. NPDC053069]|uniref:DUF6368 family protein n=1 Tax=Streptomyces sp. NPDC053069 TaxID=3365695 RepID=UPI0037D1D87B
MTFTPAHAVNVVAFRRSSVDHVVTALLTAAVMDVIRGVANAEPREVQVPIVAGIPGVVATMTDPRRRPRLLPGASAQARRSRAARIHRHRHPRPAAGRPRRGSECPGTATAQTPAAVDPTRPSRRPKRLGRELEIVRTGPDQRSFQVSRSGGR